ncbi:MAG: hypothetical protein GQ574_28540 [Crocinitomix sp.]|nr:hypothetical protein [Crocinitomix sp.]
MMKLRNICITGMILTTFVVLKNIAAIFFPELVGEITQAAPESDFRVTLEYTFIALYYLIFTFYLFKKKYLIPSIIWVTHISVSAWFFYQMHQIDYLNWTQDELDAMLFSIKLMGITSVVTGAVFVLTNTRRRIWLRIFGYLTILSAVGMLKQELIVTYSGIYVILIALIPLPLIINYWLELKKLRMDKGVQGVNNDVLDAV